MDTIKINGHDIEIMTSQEVKDAGHLIGDEYVKNNKMTCLEHNNYLINVMDRMDSKMPYRLFRLNELNGYKLNNVGVVITEEQFYDRLGCMPPSSFNYGDVKGSVVTEPITGNIYEHIFKLNNKYYCVIMEWVR